MEVPGSAKRRTFIKGVGAGAAASLAGCLGGDDVVEFHFLSATPAESTQEALEGAFEAWADERDEDFDFTFEFVGVVEAEPRTGELLAIDDPPNLVMGNADMAQFWQNLVDISDINEEVGLTDPAYGARVQDKQVIVPDHFVVQAKFYRRDLYEDAGIEPPETWSEQLEVLETLDESLPDEMFPELLQANGDNTGIYLQNHPTEHTIGIDYIERTGEALDDVRVSLGDDQQRQTAIDYLSHFNEVFQHSPDTVSYGFFDMISNYNEGVVATTNYTGRLINNMFGQAPDLIDVTGVAEFPLPEGAGDPLVGHNPQTLSIPDTDHSELAKDFLRFYFGSDYYFERLLGAGPNSIPHQEEYLHDDRLQSHEEWQSSLGQEYYDYVSTLWEEDRFFPAQYGRTDPPSPYWTALLNDPPLIGPQMAARGFSGQMEPAEAVDWATGQLDERLPTIVEEFTA